MTENPSSSPRGDTPEPYTATVGEIDPVEACDECGAELDLIDPEAKPGARDWCRRHCCACDRSQGARPWLITAKRNSHDAMTTVRVVDPDGHQVHMEAHAFYFVAVSLAEAITAGLEFSNAYFWRGYE